MSSENTTYKAKVKREGCAGKLVINKRYLDIPSEHVKPDEWNDICDRVDEALNLMACAHLISSLMWSVFFTVLVIYIILVIFFESGGPYYYYDDDYYYNRTFSYIHQAFFPCLGVLFTISWCYTMRKAQEAVQEIDDICEEYTNKLKKRNNILFTFEMSDSRKSCCFRSTKRKLDLLKRKPKCFVKIEMLSDNINDINDVDMENPSSNTDKTLSEKLSELQDARANGYLTEGEYFEQRKAMLGLYTNIPTGTAPPPAAEIPIATAFVVPSAPSAPTK